MPENALNPSKLESLLNAGVLGLKVCVQTTTQVHRVAYYSCVCVFILKLFWLDL